VIIGEVNAEEEKTLAEKFKVEGFPTIKLFVEGNAIDYKDTRTAETMVQWMKEVMET
jgi:thioredoxin-like negative regulator of GroEL